MTIEVSADRFEDSADVSDLLVLLWATLESVSGDESVELDVALPEPSGLELDLDQELDAEAFSLDADVEAGILAATQEWGDDVMTEGDLGELLRATASAVITGETLGITPTREADARTRPAVAESEDVTAPPAAAFEEQPVILTEVPEEQPMAAGAIEPEPAGPVEIVAEAVGSGAAAEEIPVREPIGVSADAVAGDVSGP